MITLRDEPTYASAGFRAGPLFWPNWNLEMLFFFCREENRRILQKNFRSKVRTNKKLNSQVTEPESNPGQIGGRRALA